MGGIKVRGCLSWASMRPGHCYRLDTGLCNQAVAPFRKDVNNVLAGLKERIMFLDESGTVRPPCHRSHAECQKLMDKVIRAVEVPSPMTMSSYVDTRPGRTRKLYESALERFNAGPVDLRRESRTSLFIKWEKTVHNKRQVPRVINPRSPLFNILLGRYLHPVEPLIFSALRSMTGQDEPIIAKGLTMEEKGAIIAKNFEDGYVAVGLDASRFDQSISKELLLIEHGIYTGIFPDRLLKRLLNLQLDNSGTCRLGDCQLDLKYGAIRCSGDVNTSLGNCIISTVLATLFLSESGLIKHARLLCDGDDLVIFVKSAFLPRLLASRLAEWYLEWGLRMKVEPPAFEPEQLEFCQARPVWTPHGYVLTRNPTKALNCDYVGFESASRIEYYKVFMRNVGLCGLSMAAGMPVLQEWYEFGVRNGKTGKISHEDRSSSGLFHQAMIQRRSGSRCVPLPVHPESRISFEKAFGVDVPTQLVLEEYIRNSAFSGHSVSPSITDHTEIYLPSYQLEILKPYILPE